MSRRRAGAAVAIVFGLILVPAGPADAHTIGGPPASNFRTELAGIRPPTRGVTVALGPDHEQLELHVTGDARVTVVGYQDEPYLRVDPAGGFENRRSPAVRLNQNRFPTGSAVRVSGPPEWVRVSREPIVRWHDHRAHWMGGITPAAVRRDRHRAHVIEQWRIPIRVDGDAVDIIGTIRWSPPPSPWPWWGVAVVLAGAVVVITRPSRRARTALTAAIVAMAGVEAVHLWASWPYSTGSTVGRLEEAVPSIAALITCLATLAWLIRRDPWRVAPALLLAGVFVFVSGGVAQLPGLSHAFVPNRLDPYAVRAGITLALGLGAGTAAAGLLLLRAPQPN